MVGRTAVTAPGNESRTPKAAALAAIEVEKSPTWDNSPS
jgi:hypothetical protein